LISAFLCAACNAITRAACNTSHVSPGVL
jgi:hypothetical protein